MYVFTLKDFHSLKVWFLGALSLKSLQEGLRFWNWGHTLAAVRGSLKVELATDNAFSFKPAPYLDSKICLTRACHDLPQNCCVKRESIRFMSEIDFLASDESGQEFCGRHDAHHAVQHVLRALQMELVEIRDL